ncbi:aromatic ring-hydroxylating dioxygenase subunit alpha [Nodosilinea sp. LEGE 07088]|uniref:aromatic ring-hydroxylating dioxygenase subunit alpha n=1 Tax=Nodosilinea sp. LEGE 07088 TaxID=2777968 RepID=UPI00187E1B97|nr:aromatic ring-hydroxylating dioxygenase subunit alpha [Nodosilinea sp. LEGE 07088]MBE9137120.1 aromatic ring-hydroxylating dioxygenase subunit alpha [Nodosilinea sp. LEGE 07088]
MGTAHPTNAKVQLPKLRGDAPHNPLANPKGKMTMLENFWYAVELSHEVGKTPQSLRLLGKDYVLYRDSDGQVVALDNQCAHRGASLALGWVEGNCLRCPYHGWTYEADGQCSHIPADAPGTPIPKRARLRSYPVQEKYGLVWMFVGSPDLPADRRPPIPAFPQFESPVRPATYSRHEFDAHFTRTMENAIDTSHALFMHKGAIGASNAPQNTEIEDYEVTVSAYELAASLPIKVNRLNGVMRFVLQQDDPEAHKRYRFALPNVTYSAVQFGRYTIESIMVHIPVDDATTVVKSVNIRNFLNQVPGLGQWLDGNTAQVGNQIMQEDDVVVKTQEPQIAPYQDMRQELLVASDATLIAYRKLLKQYAGSAELPEEAITAEPVVG